MSEDTKMAEEDLLVMIGEITGWSNQDEVRKNAITLLGWAVQEISRGRIIASVDEKAMKYQPVEIPAFDSVRKMS